MLARTAMKELRREISLSCIRARSVLAAPQCIKIRRDVKNVNYCLKYQHPKMHIHTSNKIYDLTDKREEGAKVKSRGQLRHEAEARELRESEFPSSTSQNESLIAEKEMHDENQKPGTLQMLRNIKDKAKVMWKRYGLVAIGTYYVLYIGMFGTGYFIFELGLAPSFDPSSSIESAYQFISKIVTRENDVPPQFLQDTFSSLRISMENNPKLKSIIMSLVITELAEPIRQVLVFVLTPIIARAIGRAPKKL